MKTIQELEHERLQWSFQNFPDATAYSSLQKLKGEITEVEQELMADERDYPKILEEYADCLMCLFDSAGRAGITPDDVFKAFEKKLQKNKARKWVKNPDNTYSHVKTPGPIMVDRPDAHVKLGEGVTCEWFIHYHNPETHWVKEKTLLHSDTIGEVAEFFKERFPGMVPERIEYYGIYF